MQYYEACVDNPNMLGHDLRANTLIETLAIVVQNDLPDSSAALRMMVAKEQWRQACLRAPTLTEFGIQSWSRLCWLLTVDFPHQTLITRSEVHARIDLEAHHGFEAFTMPTMRFNGLLKSSLRQSLSAFKPSKNFGGGSDLRLWGTDIEPVD